MNNIFVLIIFFIFSFILLLSIFRSAFLNIFRSYFVYILCLFGSVCIISSYIFLGNPFYLTYFPSFDKEIDLSQHSDSMLLSHLELLLSANPNDTRALNFSFPLYMSEGLYADALFVASRLLSLLGESEDLLLNYSEALISANDGLVTELALSKIERCLALNPTNPKALYYRGLSYLQQKDIETAKREWQKALNYIDKQSSLYFNIKARLQSLP